MLAYTRRQIVLLFVVVAVGAGGLAIDRWRRGNPDVVAYLESLDRAPAATAAAHEPVAQQPRPRTRAEPPTSAPVSRRAAARPEGVVVLALGQAAHALAPLLAAVAMLGVLRAEPPPLPPEHVGRLPLPLTARLEARLDGEPIVWAADRARLVLDVECVDGVVRTGRVALTVYGPPPSLADGQRIAVEARLDRPVGFRDPGVFDATVRMAREGVFVMGSAPCTRVVPLEPAAPSWPARVRRFALAAFAERLPPVSAGLLS